MKVFLKHTNSFILAESILFDTSKQVLSLYISVATLPMFSVVKHLDCSLGDRASNVKDSQEAIKIPSYQLISDFFPVAYQQLVA